MIVQLRLIKAHLGGKNKLNCRIGTSNRDDYIKKAIRENLPGPGNYSLKSEKQTPSFKFGSEQRGHVIKNDTPGPGAYRIPSTMCDVPTFMKTGGFDPTFKFV